jgi:hypothetical protein
MAGEEASRHGAAFGIAAQSLPPVDDRVARGA